MLVKDAHAVARQWIYEEGRKIPGFCGAFHAGSTNWLPENTILPETSDVDIMVVLADSNLPAKPGKFMYRNVLLEVSFLSRAQLQSPEMILSDYHIAGNFGASGIILDSSGRLTELQAAVAENYAKRRWVLARCEDAMDKILRNLQRENMSEPFHDQVLSWLFSTGVTTHVLLVAGLKNPTVRQRYLKVRELLTNYDQLDFYESLLELQGSARMGRARVEYHLAALAAVFDATRSVMTTPFFFASDLSDAARPIAIDGSRELIERGYHREAVFWIVATYSRCQKALYHDAPATLQKRFHHGYQCLLADLGITSVADLQQRGQQVIAFLPRLWEVTEAILKANPDIEDSCFNGEGTFRWSND